MNKYPYTKKEHRMDFIMTLEFKKFITEDNRRNFVEKYKIKAPYSIWCKQKTKNFLEEIKNNAKKYNLITNEKSMHSIFLEIFDGEPPTGYEEYL